MKRISNLIITAVFTAVLCAAAACTIRADSGVPMLAAGNGWYPFSVAKSNILCVEFRDSYVPDGTEVDVKNADADGTGKIRSYLLAGRKKVIVAGNGSGGIMANPDCSGMFEGFTLLQEVDIEIVDTENVRKMDSMFKDCCLLENINLRDLKTTNVTTTSSMFKNCSALVNVDLQYWDLSNVKDMSYMFSNCASIDNLTFRLMRSTELEDVSGMFSDCYELKTLDISRMDFGKVKFMRRMFQNCCSLEAFDLSTLNPCSSKDMSEMFLACNKLESISMRGWETDNLENANRMFWGCSSLTDLSIHWDTSSLTTAEGLFQGCSSLSEVNLSGFSGESLLNIDGMFAGCTGLEKLDLSRMKLKSIVASTQSDLFSGTVYPKLKNFKPPAGVRISMKMPDTGNGKFRMNGTELEEIPRNLESPLNLTVSYQIRFLDSEDETAYGTETAEWGTVAATPSQPVKESEDYEYRFQDWCLSDGSVYRAEPVNTDTDVYAFWEKTEKQKEEPQEEPETDPEEEPEEGQGGEETEGDAEEGKESGGNSSSGGGSSGGGGSGGGGSGSSGGGGGGSGLSYRSSGTTPSGSKLTVAGASSTFSSFWKADAKGTWRVFRRNGQPVTSAWLCDDAVTDNGKNVWYLIGTTGEMLSCGLVQDNTGNYYSLETTHNGFYGMLRYRNGFYSCGNETLYITFDHNHNGSFGAVTSPEALETLKRLYGVTRFPIGNENCIYTGTF